MDSILQFNFITQTVSEWSEVQAMNFAIKFYNLFLLFVYFEIARFIIYEIQVIARRFKKFTNYTK